MFYDIGMMLNVRNDTRTNHRFRFVIPHEFCRSILTCDKDYTIEVEFTEDDVRAGLVTFSIEELVNDDFAE